MLRIENGGSCFGGPTLACRVPVPVSLIVKNSRSVVPGAVSKCKVWGDTTIRPAPVGVEVAVGVGVRVAVAVGVAVAVRVAVTVGVGVVVAVAVRVEVAVAV